MPAPDFWTMEAEAMEHTIAGSRLIVQEMIEYAKDAWAKDAWRTVKAAYARWTVTAGKGGNDTVA